MMMRFIFLVFLLSACSLSQTERTVFISTNVPARVDFIDNGMTALSTETPAKFTMEYANEIDVRLSAEGKRTITFTVEKETKEKTRHFTVSREIYTAPSVAVMSPFLLSALTFDNEKNTYWPRIRDGIAPGYYYEYAPAQYHIDMIPEIPVPMSLKQKKQLLIRDFIFKNFSRLQQNDAEYIEALEKLSGLKPQVLNTFFIAKTTPFTATQAILFESAETYKEVSDIEEHHWQLFLFCYQSFDHIKAEDPAYMAYLSLLTGFTPEEQKLIVLKSKNAKRFVIELGQQYYNLNYQGFNKQCNGNACTSRKETPEYWKKRLNQQASEIEQIVKGGKK